MASATAIPVIMVAPIRVVSAALRETTAAAAHEATVAHSSTAMGIRRSLRNAVSVTWSLADQVALSAACLDELGETHLVESAAQPVYVDGKRVVVDEHVGVPQGQHEVFP